MPDVQHMKWWGWGVEGVAYTVEDKPKLPPFIQKVVGVDVNAVEVTGQPDFHAMPKPAPILSDDLRAALEAILPAGHVTCDDMERVVHSFGKSVRDLIRVRAGRFERLVDVVVYPENEAHIIELVRTAEAYDAVLIVFGGGSNIVGTLNPEPTETRTVISVDLGLMNKVLSIDTESGMATIQAGVLGPDMEEQLNPLGWTVGHQPDSFTHSTLGGWVATRSTGMQSDKYGDIAGITVGMRVVQPGGRVLALKPIKSMSNGPSLREMLIGSEGRLGIITEVTVQVHRLPAKRVISAYLFKTWEDGLAAMRHLAKSDIKPSIMRISDANETQFSFATKKASSGGIGKKLEHGMMSLLEKRGWDLEQVCLSFIGHEGSPTHVAYEQQQVVRIVAGHSGIPLGKGPGELYDQKKFDIPYIRDFLLDRGVSGDVSESPATWANIRTLWTDVRAAAERGFSEAGVQGFIMCHMSHTEHTGAALYFTFAVPFGDDPEGKYDEVKTRIQQALVDAGSSVSHHHAVGVEHKPWLEQDLSAEGVALLSNLFHAVDPGQHMNPGKIVD